MMAKLVWPGGPGQAGGRRRAAGAWRELATGSGSLSGQARNVARVAIILDGENTCIVQYIPALWSSPTRPSDAIKIIGLSLPLLSRARFSLLKKRRRAPRRTKDPVGDLTDLHFFSASTTAVTPIRALCHCEFDHERLLFRPLSSHLLTLNRLAINLVLTCKLRNATNGLRVRLITDCPLQVSAQLTLECRAVKDAAKAIEAAFAGPEVIYPLPDSIQRTVEKLLDHVHDLEDAESQRLHEELLATYKNHVHDEPAKRASFLHALRLLRPAIKGGSKLTEWWDVLIGSVVDGVGFKRLEIEDASEFVLGVLAFDADDDESTWQAAAAASYLQRLLNRYLHHTRLPTGGEDVITSQDEYMASQIEAILVAYGCRRPKASGQTYKMGRLLMFGRNFFSLSMISSFRQSIARRHSACLAPSSADSLPDYTSSSKRPSSTA